jgi:hypothetical protein
MCRFPKACCLLGFDNDLFFVTDRLVQADKNFRRVSPEAVFVLLS